MKIKTIISRQILDSRGNPTVEADVITESGVIGRAAVPSGASTGEHEAKELRDGEKGYHGKSVHKAVSNIENIIAPGLIGLSADAQNEIDSVMVELDATPDKSNLGANAILAVSLAAAHAAALQKNQALYRHIGELHGNSDFTLPRPMVNILNGGQHAPGSTEVQEFMIFPKLTDNWQDAIRSSSEIFHELKALLRQRGLSTAVGDEGGFVPGFNNSYEALDLIVQAIESAGYLPGENVEIALDVAASEFYENGQYNLTSKEASAGRQEMIAWLKELSERYPISSIEDGLDQNDWEGWSELNQTLGHIQLVGDDLLVTNATRLQRAIETNACNAILIKPNQIGTLTETLQTIRLAQENNFKTIISHRSGETEDTTIAHLAVGTNAGQIKTGSVSRGERTAKYNELVRIGEMI